MLTARDRGLCHAMRIQRDYAPEHWADLIDSIAAPDEREIARQYLRDIWRRCIAARAAQARIEQAQRQAA